MATITPYRSSRASHARKSDAGPSPLTTKHALAFLFFVTHCIAW